VCDLVGFGDRLRLGVTETGSLSRSSIERCPFFRIFADARGAVHAPLSTRDLRRARATLDRTILTPSHTSAFAIASPSPTPPFVDDCHLAVHDHLDLFAQLGLQSFDARRRAYTTLSTPHETSRRTGLTNPSGFTASTEHGSFLRIRSAVLPISIPEIPERAMVPMTTRSMPSATTNVGITSSGSPRRSVGCARPSTD